MKMPDKIQQFLTKFKQYIKKDKHITINKFSMKCPQCNSYNLEYGNENLWCKIADFILFLI